MLSARNMMHKVFKSFFAYYQKKVHTCTVVWDNIGVTLHREIKKTCLTIKNVRNDESLRFPTWTIE